MKPAVVARRDVANVAATFAAAVALPAFADDAPAAPPAAEEAPAPVEFPKDWGITSDYYTDAAKVVAHMRLATSLEKGAPNMEMIALNCKKEMIDFVSFYMPNLGVSGKQSFSTLYTAINVLAGHYTSYGPKFPVHERERQACRRSTRRSTCSRATTSYEKNIPKRRSRAPRSRRSRNAAVAHATRESPSSRNRVARRRTTSS